MAILFEAIAQLGPKLVYNQTARLDDIADYLAVRSGLNKSEVSMVLQELNAAILFYNKVGTPVYLQDVGRFAPTISRRGLFRVKYQPDVRLRNGINSPGAYRGRVRNAGNIGITNEEYKVIWDADHPDDPLVLPAAA